VKYLLLFVLSISGNANAGFFSMWSDDEEKVSANKESIESKEKEEQNDKKEVETIVVVPGSNIDEIECSLKKQIKLSKLNLKFGQFSINSKGLKNYDANDRANVCHIQLSSDFIDQLKGKFSTDTIEEKNISFRMQSSVPNKFQKILKELEPKMIKFISIGNKPIKTLTCFSASDSDADKKKHLTMKDFNEMVSKHLSCNVKTTFNLKLSDTDEVHMREVWQVMVVDGDRKFTGKRFQLDNYKPQKYNVKAYTKTIVKE